jgi:hypothetical protein
MSFEMRTVGVKERATKGHQEVAFPADMRRCKDNLRIPPSKYSPRECVWRPKSERPTRKQHHEYEAAQRWHRQAWRHWARDGMPGMEARSFWRMAGTLMRLNNASQERREWITYATRAQVGWRMLDTIAYQDADNRFLESMLEMTKYYPEGQP